MKKKLLFLLPLLMITSCKAEVSKTPYEWCFYEISDEYSIENGGLFYSYQEIVVPKSEEEWCIKNYHVKSIYEYLITVGDEQNNKFDIYYGGVGFSSRGKNKYKESEVVIIDCDWVYSIPIEKVLIGEDL